MKITVDISDEWIEEQQLDEALIEAIKSTVLRELVSHFRPDIDKMFHAIVDESAKYAIGNRIKTALDDIVSGGKIVPYGTKEPVFIRDHLMSVFSNNTGWSNPTKQMQDLAKSAGDQLKKRYDLTFATLIVENMKQHGLLKDDVALMLTNMQSDG